MHAAPTLAVGWRGTAVGVTGQRALLDRLSSALPSFWSSADSVAPGIGQLSRLGAQLRAHLPDELSVTTTDDDEGWRLIASRVELLVCSRLPDRVAVHAGVVAHQGRAIVIPGTSMSGKSTLTRALVDAGATYFSDEYALLDADGNVWPYPRPMSLRGADGRDRVTPTDSAGPDGPGIPIGLIAVLSYTGEWAIEPITPADAAMALLANCLSAQSDPARSLSYLAAAARSATATIRGTRDEARTAAERLLTQVG